MFRRFNYWFVLTEVGWEKYFLLRYGDITEGYTRDPLLRMTEEVREWTTNRFRRQNTGLDASSAGLTPTTLIDFVHRVTGQGKRVYFLLYPWERQSYLVSTRMYLDYHFAHDAELTIDLGPRFAAGGRDAYLLDGLHFSSLGNQAAADVLFERIRRDLPVH